MDIAGEASKVGVSRPIWESDRGWFAAVNGEVSPFFRLKDDADRWIHNRITEIVLVCRELRELGQSFSPRSRLDELKAALNTALQTATPEVVSQTVLDEIVQSSPEPAQEPVKPEPEATAAAVAGENRLRIVPPRKLGKSATPQGVSIDEVSTTDLKRRGGSWSWTTAAQQKSGRLSKIVYQILQDAAGRALTVLEIADAAESRGYVSGVKDRDGCYRSTYVTLRRFSGICSGKGPDKKMRFWIPV